MTAIVAQAAVPKIILASTSRYRHALLSRLGLPFDTVAPHVDETPLPGELAVALSARLAREKAAAVALRHRDAIVIGSDQVATLDGDVIGKPGDHPRALAQLQRMRGRTVIFHTAIAVHDTRDGRVQLATVPTEVRFRALPDDTLDAYLRAEQPYDCAGSAKSEGLGIVLLEQVRSDDPTALIGLPLVTLSSMLLECGYPLIAR